MMLGRGYTWKFFTKAVSFFLRSLTYQKEGDDYVDGENGSIVVSSRGYLITLSALASTLCGIVRPICLAAFRLMINSNFFGCSTGRSAGFVPFNILSTYVAARQNNSAVFAP